ncbi:tetratricopeptide repeat protein [Fodinibius salsisoli]|uniref:Sel1 repeat family protein n=1 Tax=Fodinibius salsisoli TaxID=2820877 RepID=A0ABT3PKV7_9BACT|nr:tetratricopeptide repeat protein [Fodinibius salsisoli]MCW9706547.1 sel1 repeat family protein [Fodinibius salsisoli]
MFEKGMTHFYKLEYDQAHSQFKKAVNTGYKYAYFFLGYLNQEGYGNLEQNHDLAYSYYKKGVSAGDPKAYYGLGHIHFNTKSDDIEFDVSLGKRYLRRAWDPMYGEASAGEPFWQYIVGGIYCQYQTVGKPHVKGGLLEGGDYSKRDDKGMKWYRESAEQGFATAQHRLGYVYQMGLCGQDKNDEQAFFWYQEAAEQGVLRAQSEVANSYINGNGVARDYSKGLILLRKVANQGHAGSQYKLGVYYEQGSVGLDKDLVKAKYWYKKAAKNGNWVAENRLERLDNQGN